MSSTVPRNSLRSLVAGAGPALALCAAIVASASCAAATLPATAVEIRKFAFAPQEITVAPGTKVIWTNRDETPHSVAAADKSFASKGLDTDDRFEHTFASEGDFSYSCTLHPFMTGIVHVRRQ